jgi:Phytochelatin synthase
MKLPLLALLLLAAASPDPLVPFSDPESIARLARSTHKADFFRLANQFESQTTKAFCGPASAVIVLNALRAGNDTVEKPEDPMLIPPEARALLPPGFDVVFHRYTQNDFFDTRTEAVKSRAEVFGKPRAAGAKPDGGIQLAQLGAMLAAEGLDVQVRVADEKLTDADMRREIGDNLARPDDYVIVNFDRRTLGQQGGGHISPLGAYDEASDSFLILDVNPNGHVWVWAPAATLFSAMRTRDSIQNRGYLLVREAPKPPLAPALQP